MPIYEYRCDDCGFQFDRLMRLSDPNPSCPRLNGRFLKQGKKAAHTWAGEAWWRNAKEAFAKGEQVESIFHGGGIMMIGPDYEHSVIWVEFDDDPSEWRSESKTLGEWLKETTACGGKTTKLISQSSFSLKGGGWYKDGY